MNLKNADVHALRALVARYDALVMNRYPDPPLVVKAKALEVATEKTKLGSPMAHAWAATVIGGVVEGSFTRTTDFLPKGSGMLIGWYATKLDALRAHRNWMASDCSYRLVDLDEGIALEVERAGLAILAEDGITVVPRAVGKLPELALGYGADVPQEAPAPVEDGFTDPEPPYAAGKRAEAAETARQESEAVQIEAGGAANPGKVSTGKRPSAAVKAAADRIEKAAEQKRTAAAKKAEAAKAKDAEVTA